MMALRRHDLADAIHRVNVLGHSIHGFRGAADYQRCEALPPAMLGSGRPSAPGGIAWHRTADREPAWLPASASPATAFPTAIRSGPTGTMRSGARSWRRGSTGACSSSRRARRPAPSSNSSTTRRYVDFVAARSATGEGLLDAGDTPAFKGVFEAASDVVGAALVAAGGGDRRQRAAWLRADRGTPPRGVARTPRGSAYSTTSASSSSG